MPVIKPSVRGYTQQDFLDGKCTKEGFALGTQVIDEQPLAPEVVEEVEIDPEEVAEIEQEIVQETVQEVQEEVLTETSGE
jgi:hypothetical protein